VICPRGVICPGGATCPGTNPSNKPTMLSGRQVHVRVQLDMFAAGPLAALNADLYNGIIQDAVSIDLVHTPKWRTPADLKYTVVSVPADARFTDLTGTGSDGISPSDPTHRAGEPWFVFYRRDVFATAKIPPPETIDDVLGAARALNGTDFNGDGVADFSVCFNPDPGCVASYFTFLAILGPMLQTTPSKGVFFDPKTMEPLVQNAAMHRALQVFADLSRFNAPWDHNSTCYPYEFQFAAGVHPPPLINAS
jgi:hypothetical protein